VEKEDTRLLAELMLEAERFCSKVDAAMKDVAATPEQNELRVKLGQCRAQLAHLQDSFNENKLTLQNRAILADFRHLIIALMWIAFYARQIMDFRLYRMLIKVESSFTYLLTVLQNEAR
jgi:hypothetical protein